MANTGSLVGLDIDNLENEVNALTTYIEEVQNSLENWNTGFDGVLTGFEGQAAKALSDFKDTISSAIMSEAHDICQNQINKLKDFGEHIRKLDQTVV